MSNPKITISSGTLREDFEKHLDEVKRRMQGVGQLEGRDQFHKSIEERDLAIAGLGTILDALALMMVGVLDEQERTFKELMEERRSVFANSELFEEQLEGERERLFQARRVIDAAREAASMARHSPKDFSLEQFNEAMFYLSEAARG